MESTSATELLASKADVGIESQKPPYPPSWIDRVNDWVRQLPVPGWSVYCLLALALVFSDAAFNWGNGSFLTSSYLPFHLLSDISPAFIVAMVHYFDDWAGQAIGIFRPAMAIEEAAYQGLRYRLTTLPRLQTIGACLIGLGYSSIYLLFLYDSQIDRFRIFSSPLSSIYNVLLVLVNYVSYSMIVYHAIHQMRMVSRIYGKCKQVDLFQLGPLYAFSTLAARIAITMAVMTYGWLYAFSVSDAGDVVNTLTPLLAIPLLAATFILPLLGAHTILQAEKTRLQNETALHLKAAIEELHRRREAGEYGQMDGVGTAIDSLLKEQTLVKGMATWPWQPETVRWVATVILGPVILALVTSLARRLLGF